MIENMSFLGFYIGSKILDSLFSSPPNTYTCNLCNRTYETYQKALKCVRSHRPVFDKLDNAYVVEF